MSELLISLIGAYVGCFGFCYLLQLRGKPMFLAPLGSMLAWGIYRLFGSSGEIFSCFVSSILTAAYCEIMARYCRCPATGFLLVGLLPLVPGGGIYRTMRFCLDGETMLFLQTAIHTLGIAGALALGVLFVSSGIRIYQSLIQKKELFPHE